MWSSWVHWCSRTEAGTSLAWFRIAIGVCVWLSILTVVAAGLVDVIWYPDVHGGLRPLRGNWIVQSLGGPTPELVWRLIGACLLCSGLLTVGVGGRLMALLTLQLFTSLESLNSYAGGSYDLLLNNALWLLVLAPSTATWSVDCRLRTGRWVDDTPVSAIVRDLVVAQLILMYWCTGLQKLSAYWTPGGGFSALYYILQQPNWHRFDMGWIAPLYPVTQLATAVSWLWEVTAPIMGLAYWYRTTEPRGGWLRERFNRFRVLEGYAIVGVVFHMSILFVMDVGPFTPISLAYYLCLIRPLTQKSSGSPI